VEIPRDVFQKEVCYALASDTVTYALI